MTVFCQERIASCLLRDIDISLVGDAGYFSEGHTHTTEGSYFKFLRGVLTEEKKKLG